MNDKLVLRGADGDLLLEVAINQYGWTRCYLANGQQNIFLGAETIGYIVTRLLEGLDEQATSSEVDLRGEKVRWVLSLSERHHVLYATFDSPEQKLFWQDANGDTTRIIGVTTLHPEQKKQWLAQLNLLKDNWSKTPQWNSR